MTLFRLTAALLAFGMSPTLAGEALSPVGSWQLSTGESRYDVVDCDEKFRPVLRHLIGKTYYVGATLFEESLIRGGADPEDQVDTYQATTADLGRLTQEVSAVQKEVAARTAEREKDQDTSAKSGPHGSQLYGSATSSGSRSRSEDRIAAERDA